MNDIFANTETMQENEHPRFYTAESVMRGHPDKLCDLIADSVLDACLQHDPASRVACEVMATHGHIIVAGEITTSAKPDVFNIVRDVLRDVGYDPKGYQIDCYIHDQSPDIAGAVEPELAEGEDEDTLGAGDQGVMVGYACNETPEYLPMPVVAAQRLVTLLEISRMTGVIPDIGPDGKVQVTMEYNGDTPVRITTVVVSVQHKEDTDINKLADLLDEYVFPLAFDGMPADDAEIILNPSGKFVQGGPDADTGLTGRKLMVDSYGTFAPHGGGAFSGKDATKVDRSAAYMARFIAKNIVAAGFAQRCQVTLALQWAGWTWRGVAVWDKVASRPQKGRFRQQSEYIVWGSNGKMPLERNVGCLPGVFRYPNPQNRIHVTEKPLQLMRDVVQICEPGGRILDPFAGAGTTVLAAVQEGYEAVGIEMSDAYFQRSTERLKTALESEVNQN